MNVNPYNSISRGIGKLILQDLKVISGRIQAGQIENKSSFTACIVDEFGSFATSDFADFLKMTRSAGIGVHMLCQGMADLRAVSPEFEEQVLGNTVIKLVFRQDVPSDVETWTNVAGTIDDVSTSHQFAHEYGSNLKTGVGNMAKVKKVKIEHDVFKSLKRGQAVLIDKGRGLVDLVSIWYNPYDTNNKSLEGKISFNTSEEISPIKNKTPILSSNWPPI